MMSRPGIRRAVPALLLVAALAPTLRAQVPDSVTLAPIVVTATRVPSSVAALAAGVTVLEGDALRRAGIASVADALRGVPGMALAQAGSYGAQTSLFLRGGESDYVRVLLDGVPVNQAGGFLDLADLSTEDVERIEIVRGPASVLYGSEAVTGVVQVITRRGRGPARGVVALRAGSFGTAEATAEAAGGVSRLAFSAGLQAAGTDGIAVFNSRYDRRAASARALWTPNAATDVGVAVRAMSVVHHYPTDGSGAAVDSNQQRRTRAAAVSVDAGRRLSRALEVRLLLGLRAARDSVDDAPDGPGDTLGVYAYESRARTERRSADLRANVRAAGTLLTIGAAVEQQREDSRNSYRSAFGPGAGATDVERTDRALYAQALAGRGPLSVQLGLRVDDSRTFGGYGTWRAGASLAVGPATRLRAAAGTSFKEPTFGEIFSTGYSTGNPALRPERATSLEAGLERTLAGGRVTASATAFAQRFRDLIQYTYATAAPTDPNFYNVAAADARGLELALEARLGADVTVRAAGTWLHTAAADSGFDGAVFAEGRRLLRRPARTASLETEWRVSRALALGGRALAVGDRDDLDFGSFPAARVVLPAYGRLDLWGGLVLRGDVGLTLRVENATGADIREVYGFRTPGRRALAGVRIGTP